MSREIKFRAWMYYPSLDVYGMQYNVMVGGLPETVPMYFHRGPIEYEWVTLTGEEPLMQFTGLHDQNGKEIYEGDILQYGDFKCYSIKELQTGIIRGVKLLDSGFTLVTRWSHSIPNTISSISNYMFWNSHSNWTIIGNIYENPELLEVN